MFHPKEVLIICPTISNGTLQKKFPSTARNGVGKNSTHKVTRLKQKIYISDKFEYAHHLNLKITG